jgi:hypothetical protein
METHGVVVMYNILALTNMLTHCTQHQKDKVTIHLIFCIRVALWGKGTKTVKHIYYLYI